MYNISFCANPQKNLYSDFVKSKAKPSAANIVMPSSNQPNIDSNQNQNTEKSFWTLTKEWLIEPTDNPNWYNLNAKIATTKQKISRIEKISSALLSIGLILGIYFLFNKIIKDSTKIINMDTEKIMSGVNESVSNLEQYKVNLEKALSISELSLSEKLNKTIHKLKLKIKKLPMIQNKGGKGNKAILLYGPPGTGKTTMVKAFSKDIDAELYSLDFSKIESKWVGESPKNLSAVISNICERAEANPQKQIVVFMDEVDRVALETDNSSTADYNAKLMGELKTGIERLLDHANITYMAATNSGVENSKTSSKFTSMLNSAFTSRVESVYIELPTVEQFASAISKWYSKCSMVPDELKNKDSDMVQKIAKTLKDRKGSFRDLNRLYDDAATYSENPKLTIEDVEKVLEKYGEEKGERVIGFRQNSI